MTWKSKTEGSAENGHPQDSQSQKKVFLFIFFMETFSFYTSFLFLKHCVFNDFDLQKIQSSWQFSFRKKIDSM